MRASLVLCVLVMVACVASTSALNCFSCAFPGDPNCQEAKNKELSKMCDEPSVAEKALGMSSVCLKTVIDVGGVKQITRSCTKKAGATSPCDLIRDHLEHCSTCDSDLCNASARVFINFWSTVFPVAIAIFIKFL